MFFFQKMKLADINPQRFNSNGISAFVSITRGCDNMCTFCVVILPEEEEAEIKKYFK